MLSASDNRDMSLMAQDVYMREVRRVERSTQEEDTLLLTCVARAKQEPENAWLQMRAKHARERLVEAYQPYVIYIARRYVHRAHGMDLLDLVQEGNIGLLRAIEANDPAEPYPFSYLVGTCVGSAIVRALYDRGGLIRVSRRVHEMHSKMQKMRVHLRGVLGRDPLLEEIAGTLKVPVERLGQVLASLKASRVESLQALLLEDEQEDRCDFVSLFEASVQALDARREELAEALQQALDTVLTERQRQVLQLRYGLDGQECTLVEVAKMVGVGSDTTVLRWEKQAKEKLREVLAPVYGIAQEELIA